MKIFYSLVLSTMLLAGTLTSEAAYRSVVVNRHDGSTLRVGIQDDLNVELAEGSFVFTCSKGEINLPVSEVKKWTFSSAIGSSNVWSAIESTEADGQVVYEQFSDKLVFHNLAVGTPVMLTAVDGRMVSNTVCTDSFEHTIDVTALASGVYVVTYGNYSFKILLRR